jgi:putative ABC transport system substrate-binding protein
MNRRAFLGGAIAAALAAPHAIEAQAGRVWLIGLLASGSPASAAPYIDGLRRGLQEAGYIEGRNLALEERWAGGRSDLFPGLAADLVSRKVDLILAWGSTATTAARAATNTLPIVFVAVGDPVGIGVVSNLARPGANVTGLTNISADLSVKLLELLNETIPALARIGVLQNPANPATAFLLKQTETAARSFGARLTVVAARDPSEFEDAFATMVKARAGALVVLADPMFLTHRSRIADLAAKSRLPAVFNVRQYAEVGGLMSYGPNLAELFRRAAVLIDRILRGASPGDLPVEQPTTYELVINLKTARALGLTIPPSLLLRADLVIE